ncbi:MULTISPECIES: hypothetical protein [Streptosporangium]|uniref:Lipoprotein n=1 Tax=Streptosporangium brasiliense TaxID=47480 RepID=A0ABT9R236_9ACTN|nr:hypothetical protein [Streptosporangium brasiliense]MDP9862927.1 hypothetical protein [Streptosporangium brasiliense]
MRRMIATLTGATAAALIAPALVAAPANAQAAPAAPAAQIAQTDPVSALKSQFRTHRGVKLAENSKIIGEGKNNRAIFSRRNGVLEFGKQGVVASDLTEKFTLPGAEKELKNLFGPSRTLMVKGVSYISGGFYGDALPEGKEWLRVKGGAVVAGNPAQQIVNPLEPATLKAALAHTTAKRPGGTWDGTRTVVHSGTITLGELYKVSPTVRALLGAKPSAKSATLPVSWKLYLGPDQLVRRAVSSWTQSLRGLTSLDMTYLNDSRYSGWGVKSAIKAPSAAQVADFDELDLGDEQSEDPYTQVFKD